MDFALDSSYHVLWWEHQRTPAACDSPIKYATVTGSTSDAAYDVDVGPTEIGVFAEIERLCTGTTTMPLGTYNCRFLLSEESFHGTGDYDGYWASAMSYDNLGFEVVSTLSEVPERQADARIDLIHPNPFNPQTTIRYELGEPTEVSIEIFDTAGALVIRLVSGERMPAGSHTVDWHGRHEDGRSMAAGVYLVRMRAGELDETRAVTLLK